MDTDISGGTLTYGGGGGGDICGRYNNVIFHMFFFTAIQKKFSANLSSVNCREEGYTFP